MLATGSSTLAATGKFRDSLTGRKEAVHLCPVLWEECAEPFGVPNFDRRLLHGGLPEVLLAARKEAAFFSEWIDSFYARDILELFGIRNGRAFCPCSGCCSAGAAGRSTTAGWRVSAS